MLKFFNLRSYYRKKRPQKRLVDISAYQIRVAAEAPLPQAVTEDDDRLSACWAIFIRQKGSSRRDIDAENGKVIRADELALDEFRLPLWLKLISLVPLRALIPEKTSF
jgi:hypothetical protein